MTTTRKFTKLIITVVLLLTFAGISTAAEQRPAAERPRFGGPLLGGPLLGV